MINDRKFKILEAIINDYIATAEPVGSRTIARKYNFGISPATIRNEMSDLEDMGLIEQPHTSAGRIPSQKGYRMYVDNMMRSRELTRDEIEFLKNAISLNVNRLEYLMQQTAKALSMLTNYTTVVTEPESFKMKIKHIQLVPVDNNTVAAVIVTDDNAIKNHIIKAKDIPNAEGLFIISNELSEILKDSSLVDVDSEATNKLIEKHSKYQELIAKVFKAIVTTVRQERDVQLYTSGVRNLLGFPEFSDVEKVKNVFQAIEEKDMLITLLGKGDENAADKIQILIGGENNMEQLKDCSIVKANYRVGRNSIGRIGVIGPTRMNYSQTVSILDEIVKKLDVIIDSMLEDNGGYNE